jgi:hypothetical protein
VDAETAYVEEAGHGRFMTGRRMRGARVDRVRQPFFLLLIFRLSGRRSM